MLFWSICFDFGVVNTDWFYCVVMPWHGNIALITIGPSSQRTINTLRSRQNGRCFADDVFKCIFLTYDVWISLKISLKFVPKVPINNTPPLVQIMSWRRPGDKPLSEPMMVLSPTHICVARPHLVNAHFLCYNLEKAVEKSVMKSHGLLVTSV